MTGYRKLQDLRRLEQQCNELGFRLGTPRHNWNDADRVALLPEEDHLPIYSRDAEIFVGTFEELEVWLRGVEWARQYDKLLKVSDQKRREQREQRYREQRLVEILASTKSPQEEEK